MFSYTTFYIEVGKQYEEKHQRALIQHTCQ